MEQLFAALVQAGIGVVGELISNGERTKAAALLGQLRQQFGDIPLPDLKEIEAQVMGESAQEKVRVDPALESAQYDALGQMGDVAQSGLADVDRATLNRLASQVARRNASAQQGIANEMGARGMRGSGVDIGARLAAAQGAQERNAQAGQDVAANALERRFRAIVGRGEMAGKMRGQSHDEQSQLANARDIINRLNASSRERAQYYNAGLPQQRWQNQMSRTGAMANPQNALAGFHQQSGQQTGQLFAGLGAAASRMVQGAGNSNKGGQKTSTYDSSDAYNSGWDDSEDAWLNRDDDD